MPSDPKQNHINTQLQTSGDHQQQGVGTIVTKMFIDRS